MIALPWSRKSKHTYILGWCHTQTHEFMNSNQGLNHQQNHFIRRGRNVSIEMCRGQTMKRSERFQSSEQNIETQLKWQPFSTLLPPLANLGTDKASKESNPNTRDKILLSLSHTPYKMFSRKPHQGNTKAAFSQARGKAKKEERVKTLKPLSHDR